jgi:hypothetical protein
MLWQLYFVDTTKLESASICLILSFLIYVIVYTLVSDSQVFVTFYYLALSNTTLLTLELELPNVSDPLNQ